MRVAEDAELIFFAAVDDFHQSRMAQQVANFTRKPSPRRGKAAPALQAPPIVYACAHDLAFDPVQFDKIMFNAHASPHAGFSCPFFNGKTGGTPSGKNAARINRWQSAEIRSSRR